MKIIIIGSSTGGPRILFDLFANLVCPNAAVLIVQHLPASTSPRMVKRLGQLSRMTVTLAEHGDEIKAGFLYVAPGDYHLLLGKNRRITLSDGEKVNFVRPSIDLTMQSLVQDGKDQFLGVILTGMGIDGAEGIASMKRIGAKTIVQDPNTATIRSMPEAAIRTGKIDDILSVPDIRARIFTFGS